MPFLIKAASHGQTWELKTSLSGPTLLDFLYSKEIPIRSSCMGKGICHQCRVRVVKGVAPISSADRKTFSSNALEEGWRLSCQLRPKSNLEIEFPQVYQVGEHLQKFREPISDWWLAVDLGTTGIEIAAIDHGGEWCRLRSLNAQVIMGADVMTRLEYAQRLGVEALHHRLLRQLKKLVSIIVTEAGNCRYLLRAEVAGNSAMVSFLHCWPIEPLAVSPFQPVQLAGATSSLGELGEWKSLPLLNSFVGGDLSAGLFWLWQRDEMKKSTWILMDVGTNS
ncbi:MAG: 2Fe-2S iron-sulfur cluster binding domain-containing protein, partial [Chlamydiia bacterium]|nr:2Fe-2S iron-sulfur cluster binding domain-containing protein [Chlamydiia bacterium]